MIFGSTAIGIAIAYTMKRRMEELREFERVIGYVLGEIRCNHSLLYEAFDNVSKRTKGVYQSWLIYLSDCLKKENAGTNEFAMLWDNSLEYLRGISHIKESDLLIMKPFGLALGYLDVVAQEDSVMLESDIFHKEVGKKEDEIKKQMKLAMYIGALGGIFVVILLI